MQEIQQSSNNGDATNADFQSSSNDVTSGQQGNSQVENQSVVSNDIVADSTQANITSGSTETVQSNQNLDPISSFVGAVQDLGQNIANLAQNGAKTDAVNVDQVNVKVEMDEKIIAALSYLLLLAVVALLVKPESAFVRLHARQGLLISVLVFVMFGAMAFLSLFGFLGELLALLVMFVNFALFIVIAYSMYLALTGVWWKVPLLSVVADKIPVEMFAKITKEAIKDPLVQAKSDFESRNEVQSQIDRNNNSN